MISELVHSQEDMVRIDRSVFDKPSRPPAIFRHDIHNEYAKIDQCNQCHHLYEAGALVVDESSEDQRCADCHGLEAKGHNVSLMEAYHTKCMGCHFMNKQGPFLCGECHIKVIADQEQTVSK